MHKFFNAIERRADTRWAKMVQLAPIIGLLLLVVSAVPVRAQTFTFTAVLNSGQEPPPNTNNSNGFGVAFVTFNTGTGELCFSISYRGLSSEETNAHFHAPAPPGMNAGVIVQLPTPGSPKNGCETPDLTEDQRRDLFQGLWYINIHTKNNTGGEIRGQVLPQSAPVF
jgi:CHRD domain